MGLLSSRAILASPPPSDQRVLANRLAYLSVNRVGCEDFSSYFKTDLEPVLENLREKSVRQTYLRNLIWDYSEKRYRKFDSKYDATTKQLIRLFFGYLKTGKSDEEVLSRLDRLGETHHIPCDKKASTLVKSGSVQNAVEALAGQEEVQAAVVPRADLNCTDCKIHESESSERTDFSQKSKKLVDLAYDETFLKRDKFRRNRGKKKESKPLGRCGMYVSIALEKAGCRDKNGPEFREESASRLGGDLKKNGFKNILNSDGSLPSGLKTLYDVPPGAVLIYAGGKHGHAEIRGASDRVNGFISDYFEKAPRTGPQGSDVRSVASPDWFMGETFLWSRL